MNNGNIIVLTVDDGLTSAGEVIWPELLKRGIKATFFVSPGLIGSQGYLNWLTLKRMFREGAEFGTHGYAHRLFAGLDEKELRGEIVNSKLELQDKLGVEVAALAAPGGSLHHLAPHIAKEAGYRFFCTSRRILNPLPAPFMLGRFPIKRKTPFGLFRWTVRLNSTALKIHRLIDESRSLSKALTPMLFSRVRRIGW